MKIPSHKSIAILLIVFCAMTGYNSPQPLLPAISSTFGLKISEVALMITCVIFPLGIGPIIYGLLLCKLPLVRTLTIALIIYGAGIIPAAFGYDFVPILVGRLFQGLTLPCIMVCAMTYISNTYSGNALQKNFGYYSFCIILGSYSGRLIAGAIETISGNWRYSFLMILIIALTSLSFCPFLKSTPGKDTTFNFRALCAIFAQKNMLKLLLLPCPILIASTSIMQILPFRLRELDPQISSFKISIVYTGIILCSTTGLFTTKLLSFFKSDMMGICGGFAIFLLFFPFLAIKSVFVYAIAFICMNFGFAFVYVSLPGIINRYSKAEKSVTNGTYLSLYYTFAAIGSYFPLYLLEAYGYHIYLSIMFLFASTSLLLSINLLKIQIPD